MKKNNQLKNLRIKNNLTTTQLGQAAGVSLSIISRLENSDSKARYETLSKLAKALSVDMFELFDHLEDRSKTLPNTSDNILRLLRTQRNLTVEKLSNKSGVPLSAISRIETNKSKARPATLAKLAKGLEVDVELLDTLQAQNVKQMTKSLRQPALPWWSKEDFIESPTIRAATASLTDNSKNPTSDGKYSAIELYKDLPIKTTYEILEQQRQSYNEKHNERKKLIIDLYNRGCTDPVELEKLLTLKKSRINEIINELMSQGAIQPLDIPRRGRKRRVATGQVSG